MIINYRSLTLLIKRGGGTGPQKPRQPQFNNGANSGSPAKSEIWKMTIEYYQPLIPGSFLFK
jgi:hypothetical protein